MNDFCTLMKISTGTCSFQNLSLDNGLSISTRSTVVHWSCIVNGTCEQEGRGEGERV